MSVSTRFVKSLFQAIVVHQKMAEKIAKQAIALLDNPATRLKAVRVIRKSMQCKTWRQEVINSFVREQLFESAKFGEAFRERLNAVGAKDVVEFYIGD